MNQTVSIVAKRNSRWLCTKKFTQPSSKFIIVPSAQHGYRSKPQNHQTQINKPTNKSPKTSISGLLMIMLRHKRISRSINRRPSNRRTMRWNRGKSNSRTTRATLYRRHFSRTSPHLCSWRCSLASVHCLYNFLLLLCFQMLLPSSTEDEEIGNNAEERNCE